MDNLHVRLTFDLGKIFIRKSILLKRAVLKLVKLQSLVAKCCKMWKIWPCKGLQSWQILYTFVLRTEIVTNRISTA